LETTVTSPLLITGGTGTLGRLVVPLLQERGCRVRVLSRRGRPPGGDIDFVTGDLATGLGLDAAVAGVATILHCGGSAKGDDEKARNLVRAAARAGAPHIVFISVVGADRIPVVSGIDRNAFGYFAAKRAAEQAIAESGLPWTTMRATQFHDLVLTVARQLAKSPIMPFPSGVRYQPVDAGEVAARLVELTLDEPAGLVSDFGGPHVYEFADLLRSYLRAGHRRRLLMPIRLPGAAIRAVRAGANLAPELAVGKRTWEEFLAERVG
jgi:uncharacterized protein YbjT (DUF2867 family)